MEAGKICLGGVYMYKLNIFDTMDLNNAISAGKTDGTPPASLLCDFVLLSVLEFAELNLLNIF